MHRRDRTLLPRLSALLVLAGCAGVDPRADFDAARAGIQAATGVDSVFDPAAPVLTEAEIAAALADGLDLDEALSLALLNNRRIQAGFLELGVGHAEFVQAGLLSNPTLGLAFLFPSGGGRVRAGGDLVQSVSDLWRIPHRKEIARLDQEQRLLVLSRFAGELVADVKSAYLDAVVARAARDTAAASREHARAVLAAVQRRSEIGVATRTEVDAAHGSVLTAELEEQRLERDASLARQALATLLSLPTDASALVLTDGIPAAVLPPGDAAALVARADHQRLDLRASALAVSAAEAQVRHERARAAPAVDAGIAAERPEGDASTSLLAGLAGSIEIPVFDQNQARIAAAEYRRDALRKEHEALAAEVTHAVRGALERARSAQAAAQFADGELLPQAEAAAALASRAYALGETTALALLDSQRALLQARQSAAAARAAAARAHLDLERALGAPLGASAPRYP